MQKYEKACMTFDERRFEARKIVISAQRQLKDGSFGSVEKVSLQWGDDDGSADAAVRSISLLAYKFGDIHQAYDYFQLSPIPGCGGLTARDVIRRQGAKVLMNALEDLENIPLN